MFRVAVAIVPLLLSALVLSQNDNPLMSRDLVTQSLWLTGKVVEPDGNLASNSAQVVLKCSEESRGEAFVDSKGEFTLNVVATRKEDRGLERFESSNSAPNTRAPNTVNPLDDFHLAACNLVVQADGYVTQSFSLTQSVGDTGIVSVGTFVLHRSVPTSNTVSVNTLSANPKARHEFEEGMQDQKKGHLHDARQKFQKALARDGHFGAAWYSLGTINAQENKQEDARYCFQQALKTDPNFTLASMALADLALKQEQWQDLLIYSNQLARSQTTDMAWVWLVNSIANFQLGLLPSAQQSANNGLRLDFGHRFPQLEYILGLTLARQQTYTSAAEHLERYAKLAPQRITPLVRQQISNVQALARKVSASR